MGGVCGLTLDDELIEASNEFYAQHTAIYGAERLLE